MTGVRPHARDDTTVQRNKYFTCGRGALAYNFFFFFNDTATPEIPPLPLHDALPIFEPEMRDILDRAETLRHELQDLGEADVEAFNRLSAAYKLPRTTESDIAIRRDAIQATLRREIGRAHV